jgi:predicted MFS family arabinose efflux permease
VLATLLCAEFLMGVTMPLFNVNLMSLRQAVADDHLQGRVNATVGVLLWGATPLGGLLGGAIGEVFGVRTVLSLAAAMTCVVTAVLFVPSRDTLETHVEASLRRAAATT